MHNPPQKLNDIVEPLNHIITESEWVYPQLAQPNPHARIQMQNSHHTLKCAKPTSPKPERDAQEEY
jgi:hypothetical protein